MYMVFLDGITIKCADRSVIRNTRSTIFRRRKREKTVHNLSSTCDFLGALNDKRFIKKARELN